MDMKWKAFIRNTRDGIIYDDILVDPKMHGKFFLLCVKNMKMMKMILTDNGWINAKTPLASPISNIFKPDCVLLSHEWEAEIKKMKQTSEMKTINLSLEIILNESI